MTPLGRIIGALLLMPLGTGGVQGQSAQSPLTPGEGSVAVPGGQIWYRIVGTGRGTPLVLVHGCCGAASYYLDPLADLGRDRPVIFYDQLGTGRSDLTTDTMVWAPERRVGELHLLLQSLGLTAFHLYGHSGGTRIALEYYLAHPEGVRSVIFGGPVFADSLLFRQMAALRATLPDSVQRALARYEREGRCDTPEYEAAIDVFRKRFHDRRIPLLASTDSSLRAYRQEQARYRKVGGGTCGTPEGSWRTNLLGALPRVKIPTLFVAGEYDYASPEALRLFQRLVPGSELVVIPGSGHLTSNDAPDQDRQAIRTFLRRIEHP